MPGAPRTQPHALAGIALLVAAFSHVPDHLSMPDIGVIAVCSAAGAWLAVRESRVMIEATES